MFDTVRKKFEVGDIIITKNFTGAYKKTVTRVTKTQAICDVIRPDGTGYVAKYRRDYEVWEDGKCYVVPIPRIEWDQNEYSVIAKEV